MKLAWTFSWGVQATTVACLVNVGQRAVYTCRPTVGCEGFSTLTGHVGHVLYLTLSGVRPPMHQLTGLSP